MKDYYMNYGNLNQESLFDKYEEIKKTHFILIPEVINKVLINNGLNYNDFLNLDKMRELFSLEDLNYVKNLNDEINKILNNTNETTLSNYLNIYWNKSNIYEQLLGVVNLEYGALLERISSNNGILTNKEPYEIIDTHTTVVICVINSKIVDDGIIKKDISNKIIKEFLQLLYGYNNYSDLAKEPIFHIYLDTLE